MARSRCCLRMSLASSCARPVQGFKAKPGDQATMSLNPMVAPLSVSSQNHCARQVSMELEAETHISCPRNTLWTRSHGGQFHRQSTPPIPAVVEFWLRSTFQSGEFSQQ